MLNLYKLYLEAASHSINLFMNITSKLPAAFLLSKNSHFVWKKSGIYNLISTALQIRVTIIFSRVKGTNFVQISGFPNRFAFTNFIYRYEFPEFHILSVILKIYYGVFAVMKGRRFQFWGFEWISVYCLHNVFPN